jgi:hypothetical protein
VKRESVEKGKGTAWGGRALFCIHPGVDVGILEHQALFENSNPLVGWALLPVHFSMNRDVGTGKSAHPTGFQTEPNQH